VFRLGLFDILLVETFKSLSQQHWDKPVGVLCPPQKKNNANPNTLSVYALVPILDKKSRWLSQVHTPVIGIKPFGPFLGLRRG